jgi:hypothetical protein
VRRGAHAQEQVGRPAVSTIGPPLNCSRGGRRVDIPLLSPGDAVLVDESKADRPQHPGPLSRRGHPSLIKATDSGTERNVVGEARPVPVWVAEDDGLEEREMMREVRDELRKGAVLTSERERPEKAGWEAGRKRCSRVSRPLVDSQAMQLWQPGADERKRGAVVSTSTGADTAQPVHSRCASRDAWRDGAGGAGRVDEDAMEDMLAELLRVGSELVGRQASRDGRERGAGAAAAAPASCAASTGVAGTCSVWSSADFHPISRIDAADRASHSTPKFALSLAWFTARDGSCAFKTRARRPAGATADGPCAQSWS